MGVVLLETTSAKTVYSQQKSMISIQVPLRVKKGMLPAGVLPSPFFAMALLVQTCDKSCDSSFRGEFSQTKVCFPLGFYHRHFSGWHYHCRRVTKVAQAPLGVKKNDVFAGDQWTFAIWMAFFAFQLPRRGSNFCHTSRVIMQIYVQNVVGLEWNAWFHFRSQYEMATFVTRLQK